MGKEGSSLCIAVCGWHFKYLEFYTSITQEVDEQEEFSDVSLYVASHKPPNLIAPSFLQRINSLGWNILYFDNEGWDWGAYQQFIRWHQDTHGLSDYYLLLQDDVKVKNKGFLRAFLEKVKSGAKVVGNGTTVQKAERVAKDYPEDLIWSRNNGFPISISQWDVVRGSCLFATKAVAEHVLSVMPIKKGSDILLANSSLRIFGALVAERFGMDAIDYLGTEPRQSPFFEEEYRGNAPPNTGISRFFTASCCALAAKIVKRIANSKTIPFIEPGTGLKLHIGRGDEPRPGYLNIDSIHPHADILAEFPKLQFENEILAEIVFTHLPERDDLQLTEILADCFNWLRNDGQLIVEVSSKNWRENFSTSWTIDDSIALLKKTGFSQVFYCNRGLLKNITNRIVAIK